MIDIYCARAGLHPGSGPRRFSAMAQGLRFVCTHCGHAIIAWDERNPYYFDDRREKQYAYHPSRQRGRRSGVHDGDGRTGPRRPERWTPLFAALTARSGASLLTDAGHRHSRRGSRLGEPRLQSTGRPYCSATSFASCPPISTAYPHRARHASQLAHVSCRSASRPLSLKKPTPSIF